MKYKALRTITIDPEYGIDFVKGNVYRFTKDGYVHTENGSDTYLTEEEIARDFVPVKTYAVKVTRVVTIEIEATSEDEAIAEAYEAEYLADDGESSAEIIGEV